MSDDYHFEKLDTEGIEDLPPNVKGICPRCGDNMVYIHDLKCEKCDNKLVQFCPTCEQHYQLVK